MLWACVPPQRRQYYAPVLDRRLSAFLHIWEQVWDNVAAMTKRKISPKQYEATVTAARKAGGDEVQSHWEARLMAAIKRRIKPAKKPIRR